MRKQCKHIVLCLSLLFVVFQFPLLARAIPQDRQCYNITASDTHNFVWFRVAKVGTRTILKILQDNTSLTLNGYGQVFDKVRYKDHFKFAFVRNPWDRVVSAYHNKILTKNYPPFKQCYDKDFAYFVEFIRKSNVESGDPHIQLQTRLIPVKQLDFLGRYETFEEDLTTVLYTIGLGHVRIPHVNSTSHRHYSEYYTEHTKQVIAKVYREDIEAFGYTFE